MVRSRTFGTGSQCGLGQRQCRAGRLGKTGVEVSALGVGGFHLGSAKRYRRGNAASWIRALDAGINFFDNAWEYHEGRSEDWLGCGA